MGNQIKAVVVDDHTIVIEGAGEINQATTAHVADFLAAALQKDPDLVLVIAPAQSHYYEGIGKLIYASARVGWPRHNVRFLPADSVDGQARRFDELGDAQGTDPS